MSSSTIKRAIVRDLLELTGINGYTLTDIAQFISCQRTYLYAVASGYKNPSADFLDRWASVFGKSVILVVSNGKTGGGLVTQEK